MTHGRLLSFRGGPRVSRDGIARRCLANLGGLRLPRQRLGSRPRDRKRRHCLHNRPLVRKGRHRLPNPPRRPPPLVPLRPPALCGHPEALRYFEAEALRGWWTVWQLKWQVRLPGRPGHRFRWHLGADSGPPGRRSGALGHGPERRGLMPRRPPRPPPPTPPPRPPRPPRGPWRQRPSPASPAGGMKAASSPSGANRPVAPPQRLVPPQCLRRPGRRPRLEPTGPPPQASLAPQSAETPGGGSHHAPRRLTPP